MPTRVFTPDGDATGTRALLKNGGASITVGAGVTLDLRGLWANLRDQPADGGKLAYLDGGDVVLTSTHDVTLSTGSRIDVSSGAAILATGKTKGGRGGNVTLIADQEITDVAANGLLTLNGTIAGYGVAGGGTLTLNSGTAVAIGGKLLDTDGVLKAGERSEVELVLAESYTVRAGDALPLDYSYTATVARPGEAVGPGGLVSYRDVTLAADWVPPVLGSSYYIGARNPFVIDNQTFYGYQVKADGTVFVSYNDSHQSYYIYLNSIPAGTTINFSNGSLFAGYVVPADARVMKSPVVKRSIVVAGHKTSVSLEEAFWNGMKEISSVRDMTLSELVGEIDSNRQQGNLSSAIRLFVLDYFRSRALQAQQQAVADTKTESSLTAH